MIYLDSAAVVKLVRQEPSTAALVCPVRRAGGEELMRFREGREETVVPVRFVPLVDEEPEDGDEPEGEPA